MRLFCLFISTGKCLLSIIEAEVVTNFKTQATLTLLTEASLARCRVSMTYLRLVWLCQSFCRTILRNSGEHLLSIRYHRQHHCKVYRCQQFLNSFWYTKKKWSNTREWPAHRFFISTQDIVTCTLCSCFINKYNYSCLYFIYIYMHLWFVNYPAPSNALRSPPLLKWHVLCTTL